MKYRAEEVQELSNQILNSNQVKLEKEDDYGIEHMYNVLFSIQIYLKAILKRKKNENTSR